MILPSEYSAAKFGRWERGGSIFPYFISCIPFLLFSLPHSHIFILKTMKIFLALPFLHHFLNILSHKRNGIVSNCFKINSEIFILYSYNLSHVFFSSARWNKPWKSPLSSTWSCQPTESLTLVRSLWRSCSTGVQTQRNQMTRCLQVPNCISKEERKYFFLCNILTFQAVLPQMHFCTLFDIFLTIQSHISFYSKCFIYLWCGATSNILDRFHHWALISYTPDWKFRHQL